MNTDYQRIADLRFEISKLSRRRAIGLSQEDLQISRIQKVEGAGKWSLLTSAATTVNWQKVIY